MIRPFQVKAEGAVMGASIELKNVRRELEEEKEKAWYCRASLMAMTGRGHY